MVGRHIRRYYKSCISFSAAISLSLPLSLCRLLRRTHSGLGFWVHLGADPISPFSCNFRLCHGNPFSSLSAPAERGGQCFLCCLSFPLLHGILITHSPIYVINGLETRGLTWGQAGMAIRPESLPLPAAPSPSRISLGRILHIPCLRRQREKERKKKPRPCLFFVSHVARLFVSSFCW